MTSDGDEDAAIAQLWRQAGGTAAARPPLEVSGPEHVLPSAFAVTALATAAVSLATLAAAELHAARTGTAARAVHVDRSHAALAFRRELYATPVGWEVPPLWDPIAGDYATRDGWIRLHTNYAHHRDPVLRVLGVRPERDALAAAVAKRGGDTLEQEVVGAGGCAAAMRDLDAWRAHAQGRAVATEPLLACDTAEAPPWRPAAAPLPLAGVRVLDLTRVIAGPICTSFLAGWGADVLRVDPPGFADVPALLPETTAGKRRTFLDLRAAAGRATLDELLRGADVLVVGYRGGALERLGLDDAALRGRHPALVVAMLDAYGWSGPWAARRGFDSLVQMSSGIAARGQQVYGSQRPHPLPAQALDHATGYLLAAGVCRALVERLAGRATTVRASLARTAALLVSLGESPDPHTPQPNAGDVARWLEEVPTHWGALRRVRQPGAIAGLEVVRGRSPGPLGSDRAIWSDA
ncbi:MAG: acyl-CoA transferase [Deltaproteobacteria bacterium]|nr:acyl-CoA transferase [Deltaproteobacteria bacterium]